MAGEIFMYKSESAFNINYNYCEVSSQENALLAFETKSRIFNINMLTTQFCHKLIKLSVSVSYIIVAKLLIVKKYFMSQNRVISH